MDPAAYSALSLRHSSPQCSHLTDLPVVESAFFVICPLESPLLSFLAPAAFPSSLRLRPCDGCTLLIHLLLGTEDLADFHEHLVARVEAVCIEEEVVGKISVSLVGAFRQCFEDHSTHGIFVDVLPCDCVGLMPSQEYALPLRFVLLRVFATVELHNSCPQGRP